MGDPSYMLGLAVLTWAAGDYLRDTDRPLRAVLLYAVALLWAAKYVLANA